jgi:S-disulfanyl-L-cysteine oxidoreductase SoxD
MSGSRLLVGALGATALFAVVIGISPADERPAAGPSGYPLRYGFGTVPTQAELSRFFAIPPDGRGLRPGRGTYAGGQRVYAEQCAACHGDSLQGWSGGMAMPPEMAAMGDGRLVGGRGTLVTPNPMLTVESFWPYATTLWDYIKRAMPQQAPGSLADDEVYALVAYILGEANVISKTAIVDAQTLPEIIMPNRNGFVPDPRPELELLADPLPNVAPGAAPETGRSAGRNSRVPARGADQGR